MRRFRGGVLVSAALAIAGLAFGAPSASAIGEISLDGCLAENTGIGCGVLPNGSLDQPGRVAVSPDGNSVYAGADDPTAISHFRRIPTGQIAFQSCTNEASTPPCGPFAGSPGPNRDVVASLDGNSVYMLHQDSITHFARPPDGQLTFAGCLSDDGSGGQCVDLPPAGSASPLGSASRLAISPDGDSVYVTSLPGNITHFFRAPQGQLALDGCLSNDGAPNCVDLFPPGPDGPLGDASGVSVSSDSESVYVAAASDNSISHFFAAPQGQITLDGCLNNDGSDNCGDLPPAGSAGPITGARDVATSPDGGSAYVIASDPFASTNSAIAHFSTAPQGQLTFDSCINNDGSANCLDLQASPIDGALDAALTPDGASIYVASFGAGSVSHFTRAPGGQIAFEGCLANDNSQACGDLPPAGPAGPLSGAHGVAASADGASVYVTSGPFGGSIAHFFRNTTPGAPPTGTVPVGTPPEGTDPTGSGEGGTESKCAGKVATIVGTAGNDKLKGTKRSDVIAGLAGKDKLKGLKGNDRVCGGLGKDSINGGVGDDLLLGDDGKDVLKGSNGRDRLRGGGQKDRCVGGGAKDRANCEIERGV